MIFSAWGKGSRELFEEGCSILFCIPSVVCWLDSVSESWRFGSYVQMFADDGDLLPQMAKLQVQIFKIQLTALV